MTVDTPRRPAPASTPSIRMETTRIFTEVMSAWLDGKRGILLQGGTSSTKTWSILQFLHLVAQSAKSPLVISVTSESLPHLKLGAVRDFFRIIGASQDDNPRWSKTDFRYTYPNGSVIEFWGADNSGKATGPRRDILFINEGNHVPWSIADAAEPRTEKFVIVDWNPTSEFWVHSYESGGQMVQGWIHDSRFAYCHSTYMDAKAVLPQSVVDAIESRRDKDPNWWNIYGLGLTGNIEGLVHPKFEQVDVLPDGPVVYGLDFGYSNDPSVLVKNVIIGDKLYSREMFYQSGLTNPEIAMKMDLLGVGRGLVVADAAEPKSIEEVRLKGFNIVPSEKGPGSLEYGIQKVNQYYQFWTKDSLNCIKEQRNYRYPKDKITNRLGTVPIDEFNHGMDARRYGVARNHAGTQSSLNTSHSVRQPAGATGRMAVTLSRR